MQEQQNPFFQDSFPLNSRRNSEIEKHKSVLFIKKKFKFTFRAIKRREDLDL
ncbi:hypothetical protein EW15_0131 [Prochlorococcus sp. MIT 0801]|nr:hypothetical protein EW15_0131 [Prochlorococcus sp. MIT 0801]